MRTLKTCSGAGSGEPRIAPPGAPAGILWTGGRHCGSAAGRGTCSGRRSLPVASGIRPGECGYCEATRTSVWTCWLGWSVEAEVDRCRYSGVGA